MVDGLVWLGYAEQFYDNICLTAPWLILHFDWKIRPNGNEDEVKIKLLNQMLLQ